MDMDDETREWLRRLFENRDDVPKDIVPSEGLTREALLRQNDNAGTWLQVTQPGDVLLDVDGNPIGVTESITETVYNAGTCVTCSQLARLGLTETDVPNLTVIDDPKGTR